MGGKRGGVVLLMTLVLITIMGGVAALVLGQSSRLSRLAQSSFLQSSAILSVNDLETRLPSMLSNITSAEELDVSMRLPLVMESSKGDFSLHATITSPYSKLNINRLLNADGTENDPYIAVWMNIFKRYPIGEPEMLLKLVLDTIDTDSLERGTDTEISWSIADFKNGSIKDMRTFQQIIERYVFLSGDRTVLKIPWNDFIGFEGDKMDINAVNAATLTLLIPGIAPERARALTVYRTKAFAGKEEVVSAEPALGDVYDTFFFLYTGGTSYNLHCDTELAQKGRKERFRFEYDLQEKKIRHVEFI